MSNEKNPQQQIALITPEQLSLVPDSFLQPKQLAFILKRTPEKYVRKRPAKGGGTWEYVSGGYVKKTLNLMFGFDWDFEIIEQLVMHGEAIVKGKLTCRTNGRTIVKTQFGNKDIIYKKEPASNGERIPLSIGNDLKAAATDCLKKCAAELGIASDIYNKEEFREINVDLRADEDRTAANMEKIRDLLNNGKLDAILHATVTKMMDKLDGDLDMQKRVIKSMEESINKAQS